jgi:AraC-like DNA-binding protein
MKKVEKAREMLLNTDLRISDIAESLAFSDAKHLSKAFFSVYGVLPKNFRKENKHNK